MKKLQLTSLTLGVIAIAAMLLSSPPSIPLQAAYGQIGEFDLGAPTADLRPPLSNVEWFELASERTEIDVDEVHEHINAALEALEDMYTASQELDAEGVADGLTTLSRANDNIMYALSYTRPASEITVTGGSSEEDEEEEEEEEELSEYLASLEAARPVDPLRPDNVTSLNVTLMSSLIDDVAGDTGYMLAVLGNPGGLVSERFYQKIQESANALFDMSDNLNFAVPVEDVTITGQIARIPESRQQALEEDATSTLIFTSFSPSSSMQEQYQKEEGKG
jgi:hypothetical protein